MKLDILEVGKPIPAELVRITHGPDGGSLQLMKDRTLMLCIVLTDTRSKEVQSVRRGSIRFRLLEQDDMIVPMVAFDSMELELPFDPTGYVGDIPELANMMHIVLIERRGLILKVNRVLGLGPTFLRRLVEGWNAARQEPHRFRTFLQGLQQNHVVTNWNSATRIDWDK